MKKQAMAFFTMFAILLMLSIYYITIPKENNTTIEYESVISTIEDSIAENKEDTMISNDQIISDANTSIEEKEDAILENEQIKEDSKKEQELKSVISNLGYDCSIEIVDKTIYICVLNKKQNDEDAMKIMKEIYKKEGNKYFIEVSFMSKE